MYEFCIAKSVFDRGDPTDLPDTLARLKALKSSHADCLEVNYATAQAQAKLNLFSDAEATLRDGLTRVKGGSGVGFDWPEQLATFYIPDGGKTAMESLLKKELALVKSKRIPEAVCRRVDCLVETGDGSVGREIYEGDPKGFYTVRCTEKCTVDFHVVCWKKCKEERGELRGAEAHACFTPDCGGFLSEIILYKEGKRRDGKEVKDSLVNYKPPKPEPAPPPPPQSQQPTTPQRKEKKKEPKKQQPPPEPLAPPKAEEAKKDERILTQQPKREDDPVYELGGGSAGTINLGAIPKQHLEQIHQTKTTTFAFSPPPAESEPDVPTVSQSSALPASLPGSYPTGDKPTLSSSTISANKKMRYNEKIAKLHSDRAEFRRRLAAATSGHDTGNLLSLCMTSLSSGASASALVSIDDSAYSARAGYAELRDAGDSIRARLVDHKESATKAAAKEERARVKELEDLYREKEMGKNRSFCSQVCKSHLKRVLSSGYYAYQALRKATKDKIALEERTKAAEAIAEESSKENAILRKKLDELEARFKQSELLQKKAKEDADKARKDVER